MSGASRVGLFLIALALAAGASACTCSTSTLAGDAATDGTPDPGAEELQVITWARTYAEAINSGVSIREAAGGGYIVASGTGAPDDFWVFKLDERGNIMWQKSYGGPVYDRAFCIHETSEGGYIVAGNTVSFGGGESDYWILKLDEAGNVSWQKTYGGPHNEFIEAVQETRDGGFIAAGNGYSFGRDGGAWILKLDAHGSVDWEHVYEPRVRAASIQQTSDGGYVAAADTVSYGVGVATIFAFKLDPEGKVRWCRLYAAPDWASAGNILETQDGGYVLTGYVEISEEQYVDILVMKLDGDGNILWQKCYGGEEDDRWAWISTTSDEGFIVSGGSMSFHRDRENHDAWIFKLDAGGRVAWEKTYGGEDEDQADLVLQTPDGGYVAAGATFSFDPGPINLWVLKTDPGGNIGGCPSGMIEDSNAEVGFPGLSQQDCDLAAAPTEAVVTETSVVPADSSTAVGTQCGG